MAPQNWGDNYGQKLSGYLIAPRTGDYTFWIASDDGGELWLATDGVPANKTRVAYTTDATGYQKLDQQREPDLAVIRSSQGSVATSKRLHKKGGGDDYGDIEQLLKDAEFLEGAAASVADVYALPRNLTFRAKLCDEENAWYSYDDAEVTFCYEMVALFFRLIEENMLSTAT